MDRTYLLRGEPVTVLARWSGRGPRNVWIRRADGTETIRPFRGLRKTLLTLPGRGSASDGENVVGLTPADEGGPDASTSPGPAPRLTPAEGR